MPRTKRSRIEISPGHANAAAIDIGATVHVAAVGPERDPVPVRSFGTFTGDLHRLADCSSSAGSAQLPLNPPAFTGFPSSGSLSNSALPWCW
jgi:hypothetical protein